MRRAYRVVSVLAALGLMVGTFGVRPLLAKQLQQDRFGQPDAADAPEAVVPVTEQTVDLVDEPPPPIPPIPPTPTPTPSPAAVPGVSSSPLVTLAAVFVGLLVLGMRLARVRE